MKKVFIAAASLLIASCLVTACSDSADKAADKAPAAAQAKPAPAPKPGDAFAPTTNIRYIDLDSVLANYTLAQELSKASQKMMLDYQNLERQKGNELQRMGNQIQQKVNSSGYLSQESYQADVNNFNQKQNEAQTYLAGQQNKISTYMAQQQARLNDSIQAFVKDYNASRHYDAILFKEAGVYFNPALNITDEVVAGLNARYTPAADDDAQK
ncbi:MAG: OmpH family outer membrane protein [Bacteroides sp.]|nr:OmpH family outer membrane protein [Bacteroides sp.]MCM1094898.1 OmpH family outer membrane protein [Terasakiella sp.]